MESKLKLFIESLIFFTPWIFCSILITAFSHMPQPLQIDIGIQWEDKLLHIIAYFFYGSSVIWMLLYINTFWQREKQFVVTVAILVAVCFGAYDEIHQFFIPGRDASFWDLLADGIGASGVVFVYRHLQGWQQRVQRGYGKIFYSLERR